MIEFLWFLVVRFIFQLRNWIERREKNRIHPREWGTNFTSDPLTQNMPLTTYYMAIFISCCCCCCAAYFLPRSLCLPQFGVGWMESVGKKDDAENTFEQKLKLVVSLVNMKRKLISFNGHRDNNNNISEKWQREQQQQQQQAHRGGMKWIFNRRISTIFIHVNLRSISLAVCLRVSVCVCSCSCTTWLCVYLCTNGGRYPPCPPIWCFEHLHAANRIIFDGVGMYFKSNFVWMKKKTFIFRAK